MQAEHRSDYRPAHLIPKNVENHLAPTQVEPVKNISSESISLQKGILDIQTPQSPFFKSTE